MTDPVDVLILDLLEWIRPDARPYVEVMEAWRTSCPRLTVWDDANERGFIGEHPAASGDTLVSVTALGRAHLARHRTQRPTQIPARDVG